MDSLRIVQKKCYLEWRRKAVAMKRTRILPQNKMIVINVCNGNKVADIMRVTYFSRHVIFATFFKSRNSRN